MNVPLMVLNPPATVPHIDETATAGSMAKAGIPTLSKGIR
jgi:hypothetical protein